MRILTFDIETAPAKAYAWQMWQTNIAPNQLIAPGYMLSWAAKLKGTRQKDMVYRSIWDQTDFVSELHEQLNSADLLVGYNLDKFDIRHVNREFVLAGLTPPRPCPTVDLYKVVKKNFDFPHYRLDYVAHRLIGEGKLDTGGFELWPAFMRQEPTALRLMERYNRRDVILTERLYGYLLPWIKNHPYVPTEQISLYDTFTRYQCPSCGSMDTTKERPRRTRCYGIRTVNCRKCGSWFDGKRKRLT